MSNAPAPPEDTPYTLRPGKQLLILLVEERHE